MNNSINPDEYIGVGKDGSEIGDIDKFISRGQSLPPKPNKGEYVYCQMCGNKILPNQLSTYKPLAKKQLKWRVHNDCWFASFDHCDRLTPGLIGERKDIYKMINNNENTNKNLNGSLIE